MRQIKHFSDWVTENYSAKYPKYKYIELTKSDVSDFSDEILSLINTAYKNKGGHLEFSSPKDVRKSDVSFWISNDIDSDPEMDVILGGKKTKSGIKLTLIGQDGEREAKKEVVNKMLSLLSTRGFYAEMDPDLAERSGLPFITDEGLIKNVLNKDITMNPDGSYSRLIQGKLKTKVFVGIPKR